MVVYSGKECGQDKQTNSRELVPPKTKVLGDKREILLILSMIKYQSEVSILGPVGYGPTTLPLRYSDFYFNEVENNIYIHYNIHTFLAFLIY